VFSPRFRFRVVSGVLVRVCPEPLGPRCRRCVFWAGCGAFSRRTWFRPSAPESLPDPFEALLRVLVLALVALVALGLVCWLRWLVVGLVC
jgi:hypothetical protein